MVDMQHEVGDFTKATGIKVDFETLPENTLRQKVTADIATGGGQFDIATVGTYEVPIWAKNKWIVNLTPYFAKMDANGQGRLRPQRRPAVDPQGSVVQRRALRRSVLR